MEEVGPEEEEEEEVGQEEEEVEQEETGVELAVVEEDRELAKAHCAFAGMKKKKHYMLAFDHCNYLDLRSEAVDH